MKRLMPSVLLLLLGSVVCAEPSLVFKPKDPNVFWIYHDRGDRRNNFTPSGWMGSAKSLKFMSDYKQEPKEGNSCIRIEYDVNKDTATQWAGIYWQFPPNNWSEKRGSFDLSGYSKVSFWVKGKGTVDSFLVGGIGDQMAGGDSTNTFTDKVDLTDKWEKIEIPLTGLNLSHIIGAFGVSFSAEYNPKNVVLLIDEIKYEK